MHKENSLKASNPTIPPPEAMAEPTRAEGNGKQAILPRLKMASQDLWIRTMPEFELGKISATELTIRSNYPMQPREIFYTVLNDHLIANAEVISCTTVHSPDEVLDGEYRIQCRFLEAFDGMNPLQRTADGRAV